MEKIRVLIADDHSMFRQGLKQILELDSHASAGHHQRNENRVPSGV